MALSGTLSQVVATYFRIQIDWTATQDIANNSSTVTAKMYLISTTSASNIISSAAKTLHIKIDGTTYTHSVTIGLTGNQTKLLATSSKTIAHSADGTKSFDISGDLFFGITFGSGYVGTAYIGNKNFALNTIARASTPTLSVSTQAIGSAITISTNRASTSFTHTITYAFGSASGTIATGVATSQSWTLPTALANQIPNTTSGVGSIKLITYSGTTLIGEKSIAFTATVPTSYIPSVSIAHTPSPSYGGKYVQGKSASQVTLTSSGSYGSTIKTISTTVKSGATTITTGTSSSFTSAVISQSGTIVIATTVTDSRGRTGTDSKSFTVLAYSSPTLSASSTAISSAVTITTPMGSNGFTNTLRYAFGNASGTIATGVVTSSSWTLPTSLGNQIPSALSGSGTIYCDSYSGTTLIGTKSVGFTATVPNITAFQPTATGLSASISGTGRDKTVSKYVQSISKVYMSFSSTANGGATITSNSINIVKGTSTNSMTINSTSGTTGILTSSGVYTILATTTDSRGRSKTATTTITVEAYAVPKISSFTGIRQGTTRTNVDTVRGGTYTYMGGSNPLSVIIARRPRTGSYTNLNTTAGTTSGTFEGTYVSTSNAETTSYDFRLTISDSFGNSAVAEIAVPTSSVALSIAGDTGIGVGKIHEQGALDVGGDVYMTGAITAYFRPTRIPASANLNTYTTAGMYYCPATADAGTMANCPDKVAFSLLVEGHAGTKQTFTTYFSSSFNMYIRNYYGGVWGGWYKVTLTAV